MKKPVGKVRKTQAQIDAELAASKKAYEKYRATRPSKEKLAEMYNAQQARINRSKTAAPKPAVKRSAVKPAPLGVAPKAPRRGTTTPAPLGLAPKAKPRPLGLAPKTKPKPLGLYKK